ncbi:uncharacterized protein LOC135843772 [Planococcus citri]|uniref:uncharacterized protein LOC135843772 n=1 Tax=Planococcus citri TaxID=170843 RepID=UPI0031F75D38
MCLYFAFSNSLICLILLTNVSAEEEIELRNRSPALLLSSYKGFWVFPQKVSITETDQEQEYFYDKKKDSRYFCPNEENTNKEINKPGKSSRKDNKAEQSTTTQTAKSNDDDDDVKHQYCLFEKKFDKKEEPTCKKEVKPLLVQMKNGNYGPEYCGSSESRRMYRFAFQVCVKKSFFTRLKRLGKSSKASKYADLQYPYTYQICYDHAQNRTIFTIHRINSPYILRNLLLEEEHALHEFPEQPLTETYGLGNLKNLENILKAGQLRTRENKQYKLEKLVPMEDFALGHWMKTTLHIINYIPLSVSKIPLWKAINSHVNARLIKLFNDVLSVRIFTGTWGQLVDNSRKKPRYLGNDEELGVTIPLIWWKLIHCSLIRQGVVIILHNDDSGEKLCVEDTDACDVSRWKVDIELEEAMQKYVYCCDVPSASEAIPAINLKHLKISNPSDVLKID